MNLAETTDPRNPLPQVGVPRLPNLKALTAIRFFAALHVALFHFVRPFSLWGVFEPVMSAGYIGVSFFFILSGFILTYSHAQEYESGKGSPKRFWIARFARIYPVYLLSMLFAGYVQRAQFYPRFHILAFVADLFMMQSWSVRMASFFNVPAWSLSVEAFFYLLFPFIFLRLRPSTLKRSLFTLGALWLLALLVPAILSLLSLQSVFHGEASSAAAQQVFRARRLPILALPQFLAGISLAWLYLRFRPRPQVAALLATTGLLSIVVTLFLSNHIPAILLHNGLLIPSFGMLILGLSESNWLSRLLSHPALVLLGEASFALYLFHFLYNDWLPQHITRDDSIHAAIWKLVVVIPVSVLLHLGVERPGRRMILAWWRSRHPVNSIQEKLQSARS